MSTLGIDKPPEADDWYKEALERARKAAQNVKQAGNFKMFQKSKKTIEFDVYI